MPRKADFQAHLKKIEIVNKTTGENWFQSIRIILEDIELNDDNLVELRQFRPNELIFTTLESIQPTFFDQAGQVSQPNGATPAPGLRPGKQPMRSPAMMTPWLPSRKVTVGWTG